jgi:hypothetical protein
MNSLIKRGMKRQDDEFKEISSQDLYEELIQIIVNLHHGRDRRRLIETYTQFQNFVYKE